MITLAGKAIAKQEYYTESNTGERSQYYVVTIRVERSSSAYDDIKIRCYGTMAMEFEVGNYYLITGTLRTYHNDESRYVFTTTMVYPRTVTFLPEDVYYEHYMGVNNCAVEGILFKKGDKRQTPKGKTIRDLTVLTSRFSGDKDRISCIVWGEDNLIDSYNEGDEIMLSGRFQSRTYEKLGELCTTYELSVSTK